MKLEKFVVWLGQPNYTVTFNSNNGWYLEMFEGDSFTLNIAQIPYPCSIPLNTEEFIAFLTSGLNQKPPVVANNTLSASDQINFQQKGDGFQFCMAYSPYDPIPRTFTITFEYSDTPSVALLLTPQEAQCMLDWLQSGGNYNGLKLPDNLFTSIGIKNKFGPDVWTFYYDKTIIDAVVGISLYNDTASFNNYPFTASDLALLVNFLENPIAPGINCSFQFGEISWTWTYHPEQGTRFSFTVITPNGISFPRNISDTDIQAMFAWLKSIPQ